MQYTVLDQPVPITTTNEDLLSMNASTPPPELALATEAITTDPQSLSMQPPRSTHTISSTSTTADQSRLTAETPSQLFVHQAHSRRTNWRKLKEQVRKARSKKREVLTEVNPSEIFCCPRDSNK